MRNRGAGEVLCTVEKNGNEQGVAKIEFRAVVFSRREQVC
jgi:hypothetical protein